jgi:PIN domain nuclease of toxin-antitoxin system
LNLILDTHTLAWIASNDARLAKSVTNALGDADTRLIVSAVTAYEYSDLLTRGRLPSSVDIDILLAVLGFDLVDYSASLWRVAARLPDIHRDPVDRMLVAHAIALDATIATADTDMHKYPVKTLW